MILVFLALLCITRIEKINGATQPNFIIMLADDLGYGDIGPFGNIEQTTNELDRMANEGVKFTHWTAAGPKCSPSRAALLTGRHHMRSGVYGSTSIVFSPRSTGGMLDSEITIAEALKTQGYSTGLVGKWHLGINQATRTDGAHLPDKQGFDWVGTNLPHGQSGECEPGVKTVAEMQSACFVYNGSSVVEQPIDVKDLSQKLRDDALTFVRANQAGPFFLYLAFPHVHPAYFCNSQFCSSSTRDTYGDMINEMAWIVGGVLDELESLNIDENTLVLFSSDQGAITPNCRSKTDNGPFRGGKGTTWEGGYRVPTMAWWPGTITGGTTSGTLINHMDVFPTFLQLAGGSSYLTNLQNSGTVIDGQMIPDFVPGEAEREAVFYYCSDRLMAVRYKNYKLHYHTMGPLAIPSGCRGARGDYDCYGTDIVTHDPPLVFDLTKADGEGEKTAEDSNDSVIQQVAIDVKALADAENASLASKPASQIDLGGTARVSVCCNYPTCECNYEGVP